MEKYEPGDRVVHHKFGVGTVAEIESETVIAVEFDAVGRKRLALQYANLRRSSSELEDAITPGGVSHQQWINETFSFEGEDAEHYLGSHWAPFFDEAVTILKRLPEIMPEALLQVSYGDNRQPPRALPADWPRAFNLTWPIRLNGISVLARMEQEANCLIAAFPFDAEGIQHQVILEKVHVWQSGVEAQIECEFGPTSISFFDTLYATNRGWYEAGKTYQFILTGIAYECNRAEDQVLQALNPKLTDEFKREHPEIAAEWPEGDTIPVHTKGMAALLPISNWDRDDYSFRGPVKSVTEITILDQPAWRVRTTVLRDDDDLDLDIVVTRKIWGDSPPPGPGDDIEGALWLQGYLWCPGSQRPLEPVQ